MKYYPVLAHLEYAVFVLYVMSFCGKTSSARDKKAVANCLKILKSSQSMDEFLIRLKK